MIALALVEAGHSVLQCENGRKAIEHLRYEDADLLILDILMPEMDGIETLRTVRQLNAELPILAMSGGEGRDPANYLGMAQALGATATLPKPFFLPELLELVSTLLGQARPATLPPR